MNKTNKGARQNQRHGIKEQTDNDQWGGGGGEGGKEGEGSSQGTCINDPWKWTTGWGFTGEGMGQWRVMGKIGTTVIE